MRVKELMIYPIKGLAGISKNQIFANTAGFDRDRRLMLIDDQGKFASQRSLPEMCRFKTSFSEETLIIQYKDQELKINTDSFDSENNYPADVWEHRIEVNQLNNEYNEWFSDQLKQSLRLVQTAHDFTRIKQVKTLNKEVPVSLADGYPYLILGTESLAVLNARLSSPIALDRFRANIIVDTTTAHEEDAYGSFSLGDGGFQVAKPCARCQVIGINQQTAEKNKEVLAALAQYRKKESQVYFGANLICNKEGIISVGDTINLGK